MNRFAELLDALLFTPSRNGKLRLMQEYFATSPDPERGWALAALTGELVFDAAKPAQVRALAAGRLDPELLDWSYDFVGDLAETVALIWPDPMDAAGEVPSLDEIVGRLREVRRDAVGQLLAPWLDALDATGRWALLKLVTGSLRIGVSARLAKTALAQWGGVGLDRIEEIWHALAPPYQPLFDWLEGRHPPPQPGALPVFCPLMLAQPLEDGDLDGLDPRDYVAEWKWDGIRVQLVGRGVERRLYSRSGDDIGAAFPDICAAIPGDATLDGELLVVRDGSGGAVQRSAAAPQPQSPEPQASCGIFRPRCGSTTFCARATRICAGCPLPSVGSGSRPGFGARSGRRSICRRWCRFPTGRNWPNCATARAAAASRG